MYAQTGKRALDLVVSSLLLTVLSPVLLLLAMAVRLLIGRPILFRQVRPGLAGAPFELIKFRTMTSARSADGTLLPDRERLTGFGTWLRRSSLDELPELWNVVRGEMSLVGPRPLLTEYMALYTPEQSRRHDIRPGITGWAQVHGRNRLDWESRFEMDVWYVDHVSLAVDLKVFWLTLAQLTRRGEVTAEGHATMPPFTGNGADPDR